MKTKLSIIFIAVLLLAACAPKASPTPAASVPPMASATSAPLSSETPGSTPGSTPDPVAPAPSAQAQSGEIEIEIEDFAFRPETITITAGSTVEWKNRDAVSHTVEADDGSWGSGLLSRDDTFTFTFTQAGTYAYHCGPHPAMTATIIVVNP